MLVTAQIQVTGHLGRILEINAVVLYRIGKRRGSLQTDTASDTTEVQCLVALHDTKHFGNVILRVLVIVDRRLEHCRHAVVLTPGNDDISHTVRNTVNGHISVLVDDIVALVHGHHHVGTVLINHIGFQNL